MVIVRLDKTIKSVRGRCGGVYFKPDPGGQHIQAMPRHVKYAHTPAQSPGIGGYSGLAAIWMMALLAFFSAAWAAYAIAFYFTTKTGERKRISGYNWYIHYGLLFPETVRPPFWKPPHSPYDLPDYIVTYQGKWIYHYAEPNWPADCSAGYFWEGIPWNGKPSYHTDDARWHIWWTGTRWAVSPWPGGEPPDKTYYSPGVEIVAYYRNPVTRKFCHVYLGKPPG